MKNRDECVKPVILNNNSVLNLTCSSCEEIKKRQNIKEMVE